MCFGEERGDGDKRIAYVLLCMYVGYVSTFVSVNVWGWVGVSIPSSSTIVMVAVLAVGLGPSPDGGLSGMLKEPKNSSVSSTILSFIMVTAISTLTSSGFSVTSMVLPLKSKPLNILCIKMLILTPNLLMISNWFTLYSIL